MASRNSPVPQRNNKNSPVPQRNNKNSPVPQRNNKNSPVPQGNDKNYPTPQGNNKNFLAPQGNNKNLPAPQGNNISRRSFIKDTWKKIGEGAFGEVWKVKLDCGMEDEAENPVVAVKKLFTTDFDEYMDERDKLLALYHQNIIQLIGVAPGQKEIPWLVMEYMPRGSLLSVLLNYPGQMPATLMLKLARDIACGMEYLHEEDEIHGDMAARNVLVSEDWTAKIADFGNNCYEEDNKTDYVDYEDDEQDEPIRCPIRWMSPENVPIRENVPKFTAMGDVWAYGMVLYEIWSGGGLPFEGLDDEMVLNALDIAKDTGKFSFNPRYYLAITARPHVIYLMDQCWKVDPDHRPTFSDIVDHFSEHEPNIMSQYEYKYKHEATKKEPKPEHPNFQYAKF